MLKTLVATVRRDLLLALRQKMDIVNTLLFFVVVVTIVPLGVGAEPNLLRAIAPGVVWVAALLAAMLSLPRLFTSDLSDGTLEQMLLSTEPLPVIALGKMAAHWLLTGVPVTLIAALLGVMFDLRGDSLRCLVVSLAAGTPVLSCIGAVGAALTLSVRGAGVLISLLVLPLYIPVLILGAGAVGAVADGLDGSPYLLLLMALSLGAAVLTPWWSPPHCALQWSSPLAAHEQIRVDKSLVQTVNVNNPLSAAADRGGINWYRYASPANFYPLAGRMLPWFAIASAICCIVGLYIGFFVAPTDFQQGESYRILFYSCGGGLDVHVHLPGDGGVGGAWAGVQNAAVGDDGFRAGADWRADDLRGVVDGGAVGPPNLGTYWVWDARLTSELILLFLYMGFIALEAAIDDPRRADMACALLAIVGAINIPIIYFSVKWWNTLHQGSSISMTQAPSMAAVMVVAMLAMVFGFWFYSIAAALHRVRTIILERERRAEWVAEVVR